MKLPDFPKRIELELANACNLKCIYCPRKFMDEMKDFMPFPLFKRLIDEIEPHPDTILVLHRRGEALLHPEIIKMLNYIQGKFHTVQIATNATMLDNKKNRALIEAVSFISFSIDTPRMFNKVRFPGKYAVVEKNILNFLSMNAESNHPVETQVSMVQTDNVSDNDIKLFQEIWKNKVDRIRIYQEHSKDGKFGSLTKKRSERKPCVMPFYEMLIYCDGTIGRCNHDWDGEHVDSIVNSTIKQIWTGEFLQNLRQQHIALAITDSVCANCDSWYPEEGNQGTGIVVKKS